MSAKDEALKALQSVLSSIHESLKKNETIGGHGRLLKAGVEYAMEQIEQIQETKRPRKPSDPEPPASS